MYGVEAGGRMQVIVTTHSPTIVEYASFEELFLLRPVEAVTPVTINWSKLPPTMLGYSSCRHLWDNLKLDGV